MLNKRTHILFDEADFQFLNRLARRQKKSIGELVRRAVRRTYIDGKDSERLKHQRAVDQLLKFRRSIGPFKNIIYRELIEDGRKY